LQAQLDEGLREGLDAPREPWDDWNTSNPDGVNPPQAQARQDSRFMDLEYNFSLVRFDPEPLLVRVSELFPHVCFVLGWVAPSVDQAAGKFIHNGEMLEYWLGDSERESLRAEAYRRLGLAPDYGETAPMDAITPDCPTNTVPWVAVRDSAGSARSRGLMRSSRSAASLTLPA
jgi:hypothetical protein